MKMPLCVALGAVLLVVTGCSTLWPQYSERLTNPYGGYAEPQGQTAAVPNQEQSNAWLESTLPPPPVSAAQANAIEDSAFTANFLTAVWLRFSKSPGAQQYKQFRASYEKEHYEIEYSTGLANSPPVLLPRHYVDEPYSELRMLARRGDPWAQYYLGDFYVRLATRQWPYAGMAPTLAADPNCLQELHGVFCRHAYEWMQKAALQNIAQAQDAFGWMEQTHFGGSENFQDAVNQYKLAAAQGNVPAEYQLAEIYSGGATENLPLAVHYYRIVAHLGQANAEFALAMAYRRGLGTQRNIVKSDYWLKKADLAQYAAAVAYETKLLLRHMEAHAKGGNADAQEELAMALYQGSYGDYYVTKDNALAAYWFGQSAKQGNSLAQCYYGYCLIYGYGVAQDVTTGARWLLRSARQGNSWGEEQLGYAYRRGWGVGQNNALAVHWYKLAAAQGNTMAENNLGVMYAKGEGIGVDNQLALAYFAKASQSGLALATQNYNSLERNLANGVSGNYNPAIGAGMVHQMLGQQQQDRLNAANEAQAMQRVQDEQNW